MFYDYKVLKANSEVVTRFEPTRDVQEVEDLVLNLLIQ